MIISLNSICSGKLNFSADKLTKVSVFLCTNRDYAKIIVDYHDNKHDYFALSTQAQAFNDKFKAFLKQKEQQKNINKYHENDQVSIETEYGELKIPAALIKSIQYEQFWQSSTHYTVKLGFHHDGFITLHFLTEEKLKEILKQTGHFFVKNGECYD